VKGWFLLDLITSFPAGHIVQATGGPKLAVQIVRLSRLAKLLRFYKLMNAFAHWDMKAGWAADAISVYN
jgi:hypothetical protein